MTTIVESGVPAAALTQQGSGHLFIMSNGDLLAVWIENVVSNGLQYAISQNNGATWTAPATVSASINTSLIASAFCQNSNTLYGVVTDGNVLWPVIIPYVPGSHALGTVTLGSSKTPLAAPGAVVCDWDNNNALCHVVKTPSANSGTNSMEAYTYNTVGTWVGGGTLNQPYVSSRSASANWTTVAGQSRLTVSHCLNNQVWYALTYVYSAGNYTYWGGVGWTLNVFLGIAQGTVRSDGHTIDLVAASSSGTGQILAWSWDSSALTGGGIISIVGTTGGGGSDAYQPALTQLPSGDLAVLYLSTANQANGEIYQVRRVSGTWQSALLVAGGAATGWRTPTLARSTAASVPTNVPCLYVTGTGTLVLTADTVSGYAAPNAPSSLAPTGGAAVPTTPGSFTFTYTNPVGSDPMSAYEAIIYKTSDNSVVWDSGQVSATCASGATFAFAPAVSLVAGTSYYWKARAWDQGGSPSAYAPTSSFLAAQAPTATLTAPTGAVTVPTVTAVWSYSDPQGYAQASYQVQLLASDGATVLWDTGTVASPGTSSIQLGYTLANQTIYYVQVRVTDATASLTSAWSQKQITTSFTVADLPASFTGTAYSDGAGQRVLLRWDDYRTAGRDFAPATSPYQGNWVQLSTFDAAPPNAVVGGTAAGGNRAVTYGDVVNCHEGSGAMKVQLTGADAGTVTVTWTYNTPYPLGLYGDGASTIQNGDYLSVLVFSDDWSKTSDVYMEVWLLVNGATVKASVHTGQAGLTFPMPTSGAIWWNIQIPLSSLLGAGWPAQGTAYQLYGMFVQFTPAGATTANWWVDDARLARFPGHSTRIYGRGNNALAWPVTAGVAQLTDSAGTWVADLFAQPAAPATPWYVADLLGGYWAVLSNTTGTLALAPLQGQTVLPAGAYTLYWPDFVEITEVDAGPSSTTWRHFNHEGGEAVSSDGYTYGQAGSASTFLYMQALGLLTDLSGQLQLTRGGGNITTASSAWKGFIVRGVDTRNFWSVEAQFSTNGWRVKNCIAGVLSVAASGTFGGMVGTVQYLRVTVVNNVLSVWGSSDGTTWIAASAPGSIGGAMASVAGYAGLISIGSGRFDKVWLIKGGAVSPPSYADETSYEIWRRNSDPLNLTPFIRVLANLTDPPGFVFDRAISPGAAYDYQLLINGANGTNVHTP